MADLKKIILSSLNIKLLLFNFLSEVILGFILLIILGICAGLIFGSSFFIVFPTPQDYLVQLVLYSIILFIGLTGYALFRSLFYPAEISAAYQQIHNGDFLIVKTFLGNIKGFLNSLILFILLGVIFLLLPLIALGLIVGILLLLSIPIELAFLIGIIIIGIKWIFLLIVLLPFLPILSPICLLEKNSVLSGLNKARYLGINNYSKNMGISVGIILIFSFFMVVLKSLFFVLAGIIIFGLHLPILPTDLLILNVLDPYIPIGILWIVLMGLCALILMSFGKTMCLVTQVFLYSLNSVNCKEKLVQVSFGEIVSQSSMWDYSDKKVKK